MKCTKRTTTCTRCTPERTMKDAAKSESFGIRLDAATLARLDAYAARIDHKRGGAAVRAIGAGLDVLEGVPAAPQVASLGSDPAPSAPPVGLDVSALAVALYERVGPMLADAVAEGAHRARSPKLAPVGVVGVARVVDALRAAYDAARDGGGMADYDARRVLSAAVIEAINVFAHGEAAAPAPDAPKKLEPGSEAAPGSTGRRRPPSKPRPGGQRRAPVPDPPERRGVDRLTDADVGRWVADSENGRFKAHKLTRIGGGGTAECACGDSVDLRFARVADEGRRRCAKCEAAG